MTLAIVTAAIVVLALLIAAAFLLPDTSGTEHRHGSSASHPGAPA